MRPRGWDRPRGRRVAGCRRTASVSASRGSRVRSRIVSARSLKTRLPSGRSRRPMTARNGCRSVGTSSSSRTVSSGSSTSTVLVPTSITSQSARSRCVSRRASRTAHPTTRAVGGSTAAVEGGRELPGHEGTPVLDGEGPGAVDEAGLVEEQAALHLDTGAAERRRSPGRDRVRIRLREHDPSYAGVDQRLRARAGLADVVARLEGDHRRRTAGRTSGLGQRVGLGVRRPERRDGSPRRPRRRRRRSARSRRAGWGRAGTPGVWASASARRMAADSAAVKTIAALAVRSRTPGRDGGRIPRDRPHRRALPIRTLTVGPGVTPGQPVTGCDRVADFHRRLGITPTPEHAS